MAATTCASIDALQCRRLTSGQPFYGDFTDQILPRKIRPVLLRGRSWARMTVILCQHTCSMRLRTAWYVCVCTVIPKSGSGLFNHMIVHHGSLMAQTWCQVLLSLFSWYSKFWLCRASVCKGWSVDSWLKNIHTCTHAHTHVHTHTHTCTCTHTHAHTHAHSWLVGWTSAAVT